MRRLLVVSVSAVLALAAACSSGESSEAACSDELSEDLVTVAMHWPPDMDDDATSALHSALDRCDV